MIPFICLRRGGGKVPSSVRSMHRGGTPSLGRRFPVGLNGFGSQKYLLFNGKLGMWQVAHPIAPNCFAPFTIASRIAGSLGITCPGAGSAALNNVTAVT